MCELLTLWLYFITINLIKIYSSWECLKTQSGTKSICWFCCRFLCEMYFTSLVPGSISGFTGFGSSYFSEVWKWKMENLFVYFLIISIHDQSSPTMSTFISVLETGNWQLFGRAIQCLTVSLCRTLGDAE